MNTVPVIPETAPFSAEQRAWLNGFLAGLFSRGGVDPAALASASTGSPTGLKALTVLFGSQTGTAETLAKRIAKEAGKRGFAATVRDMAGMTSEQLAQEKHVLVITSTYGDGEPPDNAKALHGALGKLAAASPPGASLANVRFSVCGLGDTNYVRFCQCAQDFDGFLEKLGARRVAPRVDCDLDYEAKFAGWLTAALTGLADETGTAVSAAAPTVTNAPAATEAPTGYTRAKPYPAVVLGSRTLNAEGSAKQVNHVEFALGDSGLQYEAGDALGVYAHNCPALVGDVLNALGCDGEEGVPAPDGSTVPLRLALTEFYDLGKPTDELLAVVGAGAGEAKAGRANGTAATLARVPHHVVDAVALVAPGKLTAADFVRLLKRLQPRLYSISSSPAAHAGQVHLTVGAVRYEKDGRDRKGVCSTFLADRITPGETRIGVFVHANRAFRPPTNGDAPMIMIGPGTGVAPFRGFLHERRARGAKGRNWLFFGDQRAATDFLYRDELEAFLRDGLLTRLDTAFSRDQAEKIYVQHRMLEHAEELFAWLEAGAHVYVCGDATRMAKDVDLALHQVIERAGRRTPEQAASYVDHLRATKRYARDVY